MPKKPTVIKDKLTVRDEEVNIEDFDDDTRFEPTAKAIEEVSDNAVNLLADAMANIKANAGKDGLTPQQARAVQKIQTASQLLTGIQTERKG